MSASVAAVYADFHRRSVDDRDAFWAEPAHRVGRLRPLVAASVGPYGAMLADGSGEFAKKIGLELDVSARGLGVRSQRYAMAIDNGVVKVLNVETAPGGVEKSSAETMCSMIDRSL